MRIAGCYLKTVSAFENFLFVGFLLPLLQSIFLLEICSSFMIEYLRTRRCLFLLYFGHIQENDSRSLSDLVGINGILDEYQKQR
jgi:hypothetical protein